MSSIRAPLSDMIEVRCGAAPGRPGTAQAGLGGDRLDLVVDGLGNLDRVGAGAEHVDDPLRLPAVLGAPLLLLFLVFGEDLDRELGESDGAPALGGLGVAVLANRVSHHGGRQLDRAPVPFHLLPEVVREIGGEAEIHLDTGIASGADIVAAVALGARFTMIGRAYLYGLMAGGRDGVDRAVAILHGEVERTMRLLGVACLEDLKPGHVLQLHRLTPRQG